MRWQRLLKRKSPCERRDSATVSISSRPSKPRRKACRFLPTHQIVLRINGHHRESDWKRRKIQPFDERRDRKHLKKAAGLQYERGNESEHRDPGSALGSRQCNQPVTIVRTAEELNIISGDEPSGRVGNEINLALPQSTIFAQPQDETGELLRHPVQAANAIRKRMPIQRKHEHIEPIPEQALSQNGNARARWPRIRRRE